MKVVFLFIIMTLGCQNVAISSEKPVNFIQTSTDFIEAVISDENVDNYISLFAHANLDQMEGQLANDIQKITFWVNVYNGYIQYFLRNHPEWYNDRSSFFKADRIQMGGKNISFEDIEHGILRRSQHPWLLGYARKWFPSKFEKRFRVSSVDYRIHFVLNCGAASCPSVRILDIDKTENQLQEATKEYITKTSQYDAIKNEITVTPLFSWFRGDFGGRKGVKKIVSGIISFPGEKFDLIYSDYDWTLDLNNIQTQ